MPASEARASHTGSSEAVEDYAKAIYALQLRKDGAAVTTNELAERLGVTPASASAMVKRLAEQKLADHEPYRGVVLTPAGERLALEVLRHHRLLELYLVEHLDVPWDRVHDEADALEHVISEYLETRIAEKLGHPSRDPHGAPIPDALLRLDEGESVPLGSLQAGATGRFTRVLDSNPEMLRFLAERGIKIGDEFEVIERQPFDGPLIVRFGDRAELPIGGQLALAMRVELAGG